MKLSLTTLTIGVCAVGGSAMVIGASLYFSGIRVNTTKSIPIGIYRTTDEQIKKGSYVIFCPTENKIFHDAKERGYVGAGFCPGNYGYLVKRILAAKGDDVVISEKGVNVNGVLLSFSKPLTKDDVGRAMPHYRIHRVLKDSEVLPMSEVSSTSFDGRYYGPINVSQVQAVILPIVTW